MDGIALIDKPKGWTSFDVVAKIRGTIKQATGLKKPKVGHTGTLDPLATGLMIVVVGTYCKRAQEFSKLDKVYKADVLLGATSTTDDDEGEKIPVSGHRPAKEDVEDLLRQLVGVQSQLPPAFSAIKIDGQRAYKLAREGKQVVMEPRTITIFSIDQVEYNYPRLSFEVHVSSGTYIRSLARDIGKSLGTGAYLNGLIRIKVGRYDLRDAVGVADFSVEDSIRPEL